MKLFKIYFLINSLFGNQSCIYRQMIHQSILSEMIKEHAIRQNVAKEMQEKRKNESVVAAHSLTEAIVDHLNIRVSHAYNNQKRIDVECKKLESNGANLIKYTEQWVELVEQMNQALKEIGDIENWTKTIENDIIIISNTLDQLQKVL